MKNETGRPTVMTEDTLQKLNEVFGIGGSDREACFYADIAQQTLYNYQKDHPDFLEHKEALKQKPILKARQSVINGLDKDHEFALRFLERKKKDEFSLRTELTGADSKPLFMPSEILNKNGINTSTEDNSEGST